MEKQLSGSQWNHKVEHSELVCTAANNLVCFWQADSYVRGKSERLSCLPKHKKSKQARQAMMGGRLACWLK